MIVSPSILMISQAKFDKSSLSAADLLRADQKVRSICCESAVLTLVDIRH